MNFINPLLVSWSLTSLFSTNMAISETNKPLVKSYPIVQRCCGDVYSL